MSDAKSDSALAIIVLQVINSRYELKIALVAKAKLTVLHVKASPNAEWQDFPGVRAKHLSDGSSYLKVVRGAQSGN